MKLTKSQRHVAYIIMLVEMIPHSETMYGNKSWFCYLIYDTFGIVDKGFVNSFSKWGNDPANGNSIGGVMKYFPELKSKFDKEYPNHDDFIMRANYLNQCINETY